MQYQKMEQWINIATMHYIVESCNNISNETIQNIINMCLNSRINGSHKNLMVNEWYSPLYGTKFDNSYYQNRWAELGAAGWTY